MFRPDAVRVMFVAGVMLWTSTAIAAAQATRDVASVDAAGLHIATIAGEPSGDPPNPPPAGPRTGVIWHVTDANSIAESICLADTNDETWIAQNLNYERLSYLQTTGSGVPIYEVDFVPDNPGIVGVASAEDASLGVVIIQDPTKIVLRAFDSASGATPVWTFSFDAGYDTTRYRDVDVSADGTIVVAAAYISGGSQSLVVVLDGATGVELKRLVTATYVSGVELSDDGTRAVLTEGATANVVETADLTSLFSFNVSGSGGTARLSRDGLVAAAGGFNCRAYRDTGSGWVQVWSEAESQQWYGGGVAVSGDGSTLFSASYKYTTYLNLTYRIIDLQTSTELARTTTNGLGAYQDSIQRAQASQTGDYFAVASWGTENNAHPEIQVFDRDAVLVGSIDMPGSPFDVDLSRDGSTLVAGGKAVHANEMGRGADAYAYEVYDPCIGDLNHDGVVDLSDLAALLANFGVTSGMTYEDGDIDSDGDVDLGDLAALLANFGVTCG